MSKVAVVLGEFKMWCYHLRRVIILCQGGDALSVAVIFFSPSLIE